MVLSATDLLLGEGRVGDRLDFMPSFVVSILLAKVLGQEAHILVFLFVDWRIILLDKRNLFRVVPHSGKFREPLMAEYSVARVILICGAFILNRPISLRLQHQ